MRAFAITSFLNNYSSWFRFGFRNGGVGYDTKGRRRWSSRNDLALAIPKIQHNGSNNVLKGAGVTEDIENGFSFLLVMKEILTESFDILRNKQVLSK